MSERIVAKAGGTSNATAEAVGQSMSWAETSDIFVVSAPGKIDGHEKVTDLLLTARQQHEHTGTVDTKITDEITERYAAIIKGLGRYASYNQWINAVRPRIVDAARQSQDAVSMLGERLQAEVYEAHGFKLLDPSRARHTLGTDPEAWRLWLLSDFVPGERYVLPGNTTNVDGRLKTFSRGGSDISGGLAAYAINAGLNLNLTDNSAMSCDPKLIGEDHVLPVAHMLYEEGRELGRNGSGLVHPAAMVPLMLGNIPTEIRNTFDPTAEATLMDNDRQRARQRAGKVIAMSLMRNVTIIRIHEPGMAEMVGRLEQFDHALAAEGIAMIDSRGDGVDGQKIFINAEDTEKAVAGIKKTNGKTELDVREDLSLLTLVGNHLENRQIDILFDTVLNGGLDGKDWQRRGHDLSIARHSIRFSLDPNQAPVVLNNMHEYFIER